MTWARQKKPCGAGLRPTRTIRLEDASSGCTEISLLKLTTRARNALLPLPSAAYLLTDDPEAGPSPYHQAEDTI